MEKRYFLYCSYKGTKYHGWQFQPNGVTVQEILTKALRTILRDEMLDVVGAGRTDAGVHAYMMPAHFDVDQEIDDCRLLTAKLNAFLPDDIAVAKIVEVKPDAHARFDAIARRYEYHVVESKNVFSTEYALQVHQKLDFTAMNNAAEILKSFTDFTSFSKLHTDVKTNNCKVEYALWTFRGDKWIFTIEADRFLRNMVRAIVGTLFEVGMGKLTLDGFKRIIEEKDRCKAGVSVPAKGLYLMEVRYPDAIFTI